MNNDPNIDFLRAIAVGCVISRHWLGHINYSGPGSQYLQFLGIFGVVIFFVLTSYVLAKSIRKAVLEGEQRIWAAFMIRRAFRIYPLSVTLVILWGLVNPVELPAAAYLANALLIQNVVGQPDVLGPLWTLPIEVQMYIFLPPLWMLIHSSGRRRHILLYLAALAFGLAAAAVKIGALAVLSFAPVFLAGLFAEHIKASSPEKSRFSGMAYLALILLPIYLLLAEKSQTVGAYPIAAALAAIIVASKPLTSRPVQSAAAFISKYSFGMYLFHDAVLKLLPREGFGNAWASFGIFLLITIGISVLMYHSIEAPFIKIGKKAATKLARKSVIHPL